MPVSWEDKYSVSVKILDDQHKEFLSVLNNLYDSIHSNVSNDVLDDVFKKLEVYTDKHFSTEEELLLKVKFEKLEEHIVAHNAFRMKLAQLKTNLHNDNIDMAFQLVEFLENWLVEHILDVDHQYSAVLNSNGIF